MRVSPQSYEKKHMEKVFVHRMDVINIDSTNSNAKLPKMREYTCHDKKILLPAVVLLRVNRNNEDTLKAKT